MMGQRGRKKQSGIGHQAVIVEGDMDAVGRLKWQYPLGAPRFKADLVVNNRYHRSREHFLIPSARRHTQLFGGSGLN